MKNILKVSLPILYLSLLISCTIDSSDDPQRPSNFWTAPERNSSNSASNIYFGFLDGDGSSSTLLDMPKDSSSTHLFIGRWQITKIGIDENNDGNIIYHQYKDFRHKDCGNAFLQFNNDGVVFENIYFRENGKCKLFSEIDRWELIATNRFKIYLYENIYLEKVSLSEMVLKYDWNFENSLYGPTQVYYYFERL
ncbi:hypothetical protein [Echinicola sp. 20G]|uniref:hypothetical protein n=1 Tax=Echinicola sp. 20G TaxID=2781961 RepID=UPI0019110320|nr:hypothetical protein [Echinicola sp. 20G]